MKKALPLIVFSLMLFPQSAIAQAPPPPPAAPASPANPVGETPAVPIEVPAPPAETGTTSEALPAPPPNVPPDAPSDVPSDAVPTIEDRLGTVEGRVEGLDESYAGTKSTVDKLNRIKFSGYVQGRFEYHADSREGISPDNGRPFPVMNQFLVRRGRLKLNYDGTNAEYVFQIDATGAAVALRDAEATFVDTWTPFGLRLTVGQFKWPFGYEVLQSSADREMPERSLMVRRLFPGERDRGLRLTGRYEFLRFAAALVNGSGTAEALYPNNDHNTYKDVVARIGADFEWVVVGLSGYLGRPLTTSLSAPAITGMDRNMDGTITPNELTATTTVTPTYRRFSRKRVGADAQLYFDVPELGGLAIKGEFILAKDTNLDYGTVAANKCLDALAVGWAATVVQNVGDFVGVALRVDYYDPIRAKSLPDTCTVVSNMVTQKRGAGDATTTFAGALLLYGSGNIKATFAYEHVAEQGVTVKNDAFTAQLQARF